MVDFHILILIQVIRVSFHRYTMAVSNKQNDATINGIFVRWHVHSNYWIHWIQLSREREETVSSKIENFERKRPKFNEKFDAIPLDPMIYVYTCDGRAKWHILVLCVRVCGPFLDA